MDSAEVSPQGVASTNDVHQELARLGAQLENRQSITFIARGCVASFFGTIAFGICMLLVAQSARLPHWFWPILVVFAACLVVAIVSFLKAARTFRSERALYEQFRALRAKLGLE